MEASSPALDPPAVLDEVQRIAAVAAPLDLHKGICDPRPVERSSARCDRWPENLRLRSIGPGGVAWHVGRCRSPNLCVPCARLAAVETSEMLWLNALENAPSCWVVLTAREFLTRKDTHDHLRQLSKVCRRRWPAVQWAVTVEFQQRGALHLNLLVNGVPPGERDAFFALLVERWCARVDASPVAQSLRDIYDGAGLIRYVSLHFMKPEQAPPVGWRGQRVSYTRKFLVRPASVMRVEARQSLQRKREIWKLRRDLGEGFEALDALDLEVLIEQRLETLSQTRWELHRGREHPMLGFMPERLVRG